MASFFWKFFKANHGWQRRSRSQSSAGFQVCRVAAFQSRMAHDFTCPADSWVRAKVERSPRRLLSALSTERDCACGDWFWYRLEEKPIDLTFPGQALCGFHVGSRCQTLLSISARMSCRAKSRHL